MYNTLYAGKAQFPHTLSDFSDSCQFRQFFPVEKSGACLASWEDALSWLRWLSAIYQLPELGTSVLALHCVLAEALTAARSSCNVVHTE